jgi:hypothetical protein
MMTNYVPRTSPTWKRFLLAQWLYDSVPFDGTTHPFSSPTTAAGRDDTEAARRAQDTANTTKRRVVAAIDVQNDRSSRINQTRSL